MAVNKARVDEGGGGSGSGGNSNKTNTTTTTTTNNNNTKLNTDTSVVDYYKSTGRDSSFAARREAAVDLGIVDDPADYTGTASQNTALLKATKAEDKSNKQEDKTDKDNKTNKDKTDKDNKDNKDNKNNNKVDTPADAVTDVADVIAEAIPTGGQYTYNEIPQMQLDQRTLMSAAELARLYGLDYNLQNINDTLMKATDAGYAVRYDDQKNAENTYYTNAATAQSTLSDVLQRQQSQAIMAGTNRGMQAAQALSAVLGTSQQFAQNATMLAQDRAALAKEYAAAKATTGVNALNTYNTMGQQLADISKNVYSTDTSAYVGQLDYNASVNTSNAQMASQAMASKAQWESTLASSLAGVYQNYYNGQITLEEAQIQANAAIQSAKVYGVDAATVNAAASQAIAQTNANATIGAANIAAGATTQAAQIAANSNNSIVTANNAATQQQNSANLTTSIIAGVNSGATTPDDALNTVAGYYASGLIDSTTYQSTIDYINGKKNGTTTTTTPQVDAVSGAQPTNNSTTTNNDYYNQWASDPGARRTN